MNKAISFLFIVFILFSCASTTKLTATMESYQNTLTQIDKIKKKPERKKHWDQLAYHYNNSVVWFENEIKTEQDLSTDFKWNNVVTNMMFLNALSDSIQKLPNASEYIPDLTIYDSQLTEAKIKAAQECIAQAELLMKYTDNKPANKMAIIYLRRALRLDPTQTHLVQKIEILNNELSTKKQQD